MQRREFMAGLGAAAGDAVFQFGQVYGQGSSAVAHYDAQVIPVRFIHVKRCENRSRRSSFELSPIFGDGVIGQAAEVAG